MNKLCCRCKIEIFTKCKYCNKCNAEYMRSWRKNHKLSDDQKKKASTRSKTNVLIKRNKLIRKPCEVCGDKKSEAHHHNYEDYRNVSWLCFKHHREHHQNTVL